MADSDPDVRWMSYAEAARALGVNPESVARRMRRGNWARTKGNDGKPRVAVPVNALPVPDNDRDAVPDSEAAALREALARERGRADRAEARADRVETAAADARALADRRLQEIAELRERAGRAEGEVEALRRPWWGKLLGR